MDITAVILERTFLLSTRSQSMLQASSSKLCSFDRGGAHLFFGTGCLTLGLMRLEIEEGERKKEKKDNLWPGNWEEGGRSK